MVSQGEALDREHELYISRVHCKKCPITKTFFLPYPSLRLTFPVKKGLRKEQINLTK